MKYEGIETLAVTGKGTTKNRVESIAKFTETDEESRILREQSKTQKIPSRNRVLILSSVGNAGLNLHIANALIFVVRNLLIYAILTESGL